MISIVAHPLKRPAESQLSLLTTVLDLFGVDYRYSTVDDLPESGIIITDCFVMETSVGDPGNDLALAILNGCRNNKIVFYYPSESYATLSASFCPTVDICKEKGIEAYLVKCGDWDIDGFVKNYNLSTFFSWIISSKFNLARLAYTWHKIDTAIKTHKFLFFNGEYRINREHFFGLYQQAGLLENSIWSHRGGKGDSGHKPANDWPDPFVHPDFRFYAYLPSHYYQTRLGMISETAQNEFFPTEKIYKSLMLGHPFVVYSAQGCLEKLQNLGFKTYSDYIDETYDQVEYPFERAEKIINTLRTCPDDIDIVAKDINTHNRKHFLFLSNKIYLEVLDILIDIDPNLKFKEEFEVDSVLLNKYFL